MDGGQEHVGGAPWEAPQSREPQTKDTDTSANPASRTNQPSCRLLAPRAVDWFSSKRYILRKVPLDPIFLMQNGDIKAPLNAFPIGDTFLSVSRENKHLI